MVFALVEDALLADGIRLFFTDLMAVYEDGHMPCAWNGDVEAHGVSEGEVVVC